jgi:hypothetical protein
MDRPGDYLPDVTEGITRGEDLPPPHFERRSRNYRRRKGPRCGRPAPRCSLARRTRHDLGNARTGRPIDLVVTSSQQRWSPCRRCFNADLSDLALAKCHSTPRVPQTAVRRVAKHGLPARSASGPRWRDPRVFVPGATVPNWVEAAGGKKPWPAWRPTLSPAAWGTSAAPSPAMSGTTAHSASFPWSTTAPSPA